MHIILVSSKLAKARSLTLTNRHLVASVVFMALLVFSLTLGLFWITVRHATEFKLPLLDSLVLSAQEAQRRKTEEFLRENLNAMAVKLGQMQAQLMRLDALGERLSALAGLKPGEFRFNEPPRRGGAGSGNPTPGPITSTATWSRSTTATISPLATRIARSFSSRKATLSSAEARWRNPARPAAPPVRICTSKSATGASHRTRSGSFRPRRASAAPTAVGIHSAGPRAPSRPCRRKRCSGVINSKLLHATAVIPR